MRAIILAAGMGTRLRPLTDNKPKSLVEVAGEAMAERQVRFLKEKGIDDIVMVVGYQKEAFEYLVDRYGVRLVFNEKFDVHILYVQGKRPFRGVICPRRRCIHEQKYHRPWYF